MAEIDEYEETRGFFVNVTGSIFFCLEQSSICIFN